MKIVIPYYNFYSVKWWNLKLGKRRLLRFIISLLPKPRLHSLAQKIAGVAERFEFYYKGLELANGFHELTDAREQQYRFEKDNRLREKAGLPQREIDYRFLGALQAGIPNTSGVALRGRSFNYDCIRRRKVLKK